MRKALVIGVAAVALIAFSGLASGSCKVYMQYWEKNGSNGWIYYGEIVPGCEYWGRWRETNHQVWKECDGVIYLPTHVNQHISWSCKIIENNKPVVICHYNYMYHYEFSPNQLNPREKEMGYFRCFLKDPSTQCPKSCLVFPPYKIPLITKFHLHPTIEDTSTLTSFIFENIDFTLIPLIDRIEFYGVTIDVALL